MTVVTDASDPGPVSGPCPPGWQLSFSGPSDMHSWDPAAAP